MNVGIIVYSQTGNTLSVAKRLKDALEAKGLQAAVERVTIEGEKLTNEPIIITSAPDAAKYDALVFASPVMAFSLCPVMKQYLKQLPDLKGKKAGCFVTQGLPYDWMGGSRAIRIMSAALKDKGAEVAATGIVHWKNETAREEQAAKTVEALCAAL
ncbi:MAG: flavodoxin family protein [Burkholderiales bacterium]